MQAQTLTKAKRGRPQVHANSAARQQAYRDRQKMTLIHLDEQTMQLLETYIKNSGKQLTKSKALELILRDELLQISAAQIPQK